MNNAHPRLQTKKESRLLAQKRAANKKYYKKLREQTAEEKFIYDQFMLWHKLRAIFTRKEYVYYDDLPEALKSQISPFDEVIYPVRGMDTPAS